MVKDRGWQLAGLLASILLAASLQRLADHEVRIHTIEKLQAGNDPAIRALNEHFTAFGVLSERVVRVETILEQMARREGVQVPKPVDERIGG